MGGPRMRLALLAALASCREVKSVLAGLLPACLLVVISAGFLRCNYQCRHHMSGAQPPEVLADLFKQVLQQQAPAGDS